VSYTLAQTAGNLNIVVIGWTDTTTTVQSVTDSDLNTYTLAFSPTVGTGLSQAIYYAKNIAAGSGNLVTVTFNAAAQNPNVRILEYSGLDLASPLDDTNGVFGTGTVLDSGSVFTTVAGDLVIGAAMAGGTVVTTSRPFITVGTTPSGSNVEHLVGPAAGRIDATATQDTSTDWVMQAVGFRQAGTVLDFAISVTPPASATVVAGAPATFTISVSPINGFVSPVTLTCSGLPLGTSCAFVPPTVTPGATAVTSTLTITTTSATPAATTPVTVTGAFNSLSHDATVSLTVTGVADFTISAAALSPASVAAGGSATSTVTIAPISGFTGSVSLTCSVAPVATRGPTCSLNPASVAGGSGSSTLTVSTTPATTAMLAPPSRGLFYAMCLPIAGLALFGTGLTSRKKKLWGFLLGCLLFSSLMILPACGGSSSGGGGGHPGTPAGAYTVTVSGTSGSLTHTTTASLTVQ